MSTNDRITPLGQLRRLGLWLALSGLSLGLFLWQLLHVRHLESVLLQNQVDPATQRQILIWIGGTTLSLVLGVSLFLADRHGESFLFSLSLADGRLDKVVGGGAQYTDVTLDARGHRAAVLAVPPTSAGDLHCVDVVNSASSPVSAYNQPYFQAHRIILQQVVLVSRQRRSLGPMARRTSSRAKPKKDPRPAPPPGDAKGPVKDALVPRSGRPEIHWPAIPKPREAAVLALLYQYEESQWWPAETLVKHQLLQLEQLLGYAARAVPLYRERLKVLAGTRRGHAARTR